MKNHPPHKYCAGREEDELPVVPVKKKIEKIEIKQSKVAKGDTIVHLIIAMADEMVVIKNKLNEVIDKLNNL